MGRITLKLVDSIAKIKKDVNAAIASHINEAVEKGKGSLVSRARPLVSKWILEQPEVQSLIDGSPGSLAAEVGIPHGKNKGVVDYLVSSIVSATSVKLYPFDAGLTRGRLELNFQPIDFSNLLDTAMFDIFTKKGVKLEWLRWLLEEGAKPIIIGYEYTPTSGRGRSNAGTMKSGIAWRIRPSFAGTVENNFITRAFSYRQRDIEKLFAQVIGGLR
jgi:hypothetical protein